MADDSNSPERERTSVPSSAADIREAEPGRRRPGNRPGGSSGRRRGDHSGSGSGSRRRRGDHSGGLYNPGGDSERRKSHSPSEIDNAENEAARAEREAEGLYNDDGSDKGWRRRAFKKYRKRAAVGGVAGLSVGTIMLFMSVAQGPLEFIHLAQLMDKFHFSNQQDAEDGRLQAMIRYIHDPSKPQNTRLGIAGNIAADHLESKINQSTGLKSAYDPTTGTDRGYIVDRANERFKGKTVPQIKAELSASFSVDPSTVSTSVIDGKEVIAFNPDPRGLNTVKRYRAQTKFSRGLLKAAGYSKLTAHVGSRVLGARAGWTFHPIKKLDATIQDSIVKGGKAAKDKLKEKLVKENATYEANGEVTRPGGNPSAKTQTDADGNTVTNPESEEAAKGAQDLQANAQDLNATDPESTKAFTDKMSVKLAAGGASGIGVACVIRNLNSSIKEEKFGKLILPMMRKSGKAISIGSQGQSGEDLDATQLGIYKDFLDSKNDKGKVTSSWPQARSIQAENNQPLTGPDLPKEDQVFTGAGASPFAFIDGASFQAVLDPACGVLESTFGQIFSIVTGPVSFVVSSAVLSQALPALAGWLSGAPLSPIAAGADYGNIVNYGSRLSANDMFAAAGGVIMDTADEIVLKDTNSALDKQDFESKNIAYRLFNTQDSRTLAAHLIDTQDLSVSQNVASIASSFNGIFKTAFKVPATLLWARSAAADDTPYDYHGLKAVGFTASELGDRRFENPFRNACHVVGCHDSKTNITGAFEDPAKAQKYIDRAKKCFDINISDDGGKWSIDSLTTAVNFNSGDYPSECKSSEEDWLRVRFWLLDTPTIEGYVCSQGLDDTSCKTLGFKDPAGSDSAPSVTPVSGDAQELAQQILSNKNIDLDCYSSSVRPDIEDAAAGKPSTAGAPVSSAILQLIATVGQTHSVCITAIESNGGGHSANSYHYTGDAVDFGSLDGTTIDGRNAPSLTVIQAAYSVLPKGSALGQAQCGTTPQAPPGWDPPFNDTCNHLHIQVPRETP